MKLPLRTYARGTLLVLGFVTWIVLVLSLFTECNCVMVYTNRYGELYLELIVSTIIIIVNACYLWRELIQECKEIAGEA